MQGKYGIFRKSEQNGNNPFHKAAHSMYALCQILNSSRTFISFMSSGLSVLTASAKGT